MSAHEPPDWWQDIDALPEWMHDALTASQMGLPNVMKWTISIRWCDALNAGQKHVALTLSTYMDATKLIANPSVGTLAANCGRSAKTVRRCLQELQANGWLTITPYQSTNGKNRVPNRYAGTFPADLQVRRSGHRTIGIGASQE